MAKTRVLVVDDAVVIRRLVSEAVSSDPDLELCGWASNGKIALSKIPQVNPDCVTLDVEMPEMDGIEMLKELRKTHPRLPVIMFSTLTGKGAQRTLDALASGATDYVTKPANVGSVVECLDRLRDELIPKIKIHARSSTGRASAISPSVVRHVARPGFVEPEIVCIASSTGGPNALSTLVQSLPADLGVPILVVQHMPPVFTNLFAKRLNEIGPIAAEEGTDGAEVKPCHIYVAPGGKHMELDRRNGKLLLRLTEDPLENSCRPAADVLFRSVVHHFGGAVLGAVLTGMGYDGLRGSRAIIEAGGSVLAQDQPTSVVWGMPGAVCQAGLAAEVLPLAEIGGAIGRRVKKRLVAGHAC